MIDGKVYDIMLFVVLDVLGSFAVVIPKPESHKSPAAVVSWAVCTLAPPSPANLRVPKPSELIATEWLSNGAPVPTVDVPEPIAVAVSSPWSNTNEIDTFKPLSNSPAPLNNWYP